MGEKKQELRNGTKSPLNVETRLKHLSEPLLGGFGRELSRPSATHQIGLESKCHLTDTQ